MSILDYGAIQLRTHKATSAKSSGIADKQPAWLTERMQAAATRPLDPEVVIQWQARTLIRSRLKSYTRHL